MGDDEPRSPIGDRSMMMTTSAMTRYLIMHGDDDDHDGHV
jgi:hypothetical protein